MGLNLQILLSLCDDDDGVDDDNDKDTDDDNDDDNDDDDDDDIYFVRELKFHFGECAVKLGTIQIQTRLRASLPVLTRISDNHKNTNTNTNLYLNRIHINT